MRGAKVKYKITSRKMKYLFLITNNSKEEKWSYDDLFFRCVNPNEKIINVGESMKLTNIFFSLK